MFWSVSGFIALVISYDAAADICAHTAFRRALVGPVTIITSLMDMSIGVLIAFRRTCAVGLIAGIVASLGYMTGCGDPDAGPLDRTARRAGEDRPRHRADDGRVDDVG